MAQFRAEAQWHNTIGSISIINWWSSKYVPIYIYMFLYICESNAKISRVVLVIVNQRSGSGYIHMYHVPVA